MAQTRSKSKAQLFDPALIDYYEALYPEETSPTALLNKFILHRPPGSEQWDAEDQLIMAGELHAWLTSTSFDSSTHPRLCSVGAVAGMYTFSVTLEPVVREGRGYRPSATTMKGHLMPHGTRMDKTIKMAAWDGYDK